MSFFALIKAKKYKYQQKLYLAENVGEALETPNSALRRACNTTLMLHYRHYFQVNA